MVAKRTPILEKEVLPEFTLWLSHNQDCWHRRMLRSLQISKESQKSQLCDCNDDCPAHPKNRLLHIGDLCIHADGTKHKIKPKITTFQINFNNN